MCKTKKQQVAAFYAKARGWWNYNTDDYDDIETQGDCYEFADDIINIVTDGKGL